MTVNDSPSSLAWRRLRALALALATGALACAALLVLMAWPARAAGAAGVGNAVVNPGDSIQAAINAANPGNLIFINAGTYTESLTLNKEVSLVGANSATVFLQALPGQRVITVTGAAVNTNVTIASLTIQGGDVDGGSSCPQNCGGGMYITLTAQPLLQNLVFRNNLAWQGGGIYAAANLTITGGLFTNNTATGAGGGLHIEETHLPDPEYRLVLSGTQFISNTAGGEGGGGAYVFGTTVLSNGYFERNRCGGGTCYGGGLETRQLLMTDTVFLTNTVTGNGGGVYATIDTVISGGLFAGNRAGGFGGGLHTLFVDPGQVVRVTGARFERNSCTFTACNGGALMTQSTLNMILSDTDFLSSTSKGSGGGVYTGALLTMTAGSFQGNTCISAGCTGGGLSAGTAAWLDGTVFRNNTSQSSGGGAFFPGPASVTDAVFQDNACAAASCTGGGVRAENSLGLTNTQLIHNSSLGAGGGVAHVGAGDLRLVNSLFVRNAAGAPGLALWFASPGSGQVLHTTFANPSSAGGAAVSVENGSLGLTNTIVASYSVGISLTSGSAFEDYTLFFGVGTPTLGGVVSGSHHPTGDPLFVNPAADNYRLGPGSPAIDAGANVGVTTDFEGDPRPQDDGYDLGYDESPLMSLLYLPLIRR